MPFFFWDKFSFDVVAYRVIVAINWKRYHSCTFPLHIWIVVGFQNLSNCEILIQFEYLILLSYLLSLLVQVDYTTVFVFRLLMFVDNGLAAGMGL
jgi:E3 ubiquitin-protein ligase SIS3